jgi:ribosomal protein S18 acetylase RimI-like enzyme
MFASALPSTPMPACASSRDLAASVRGSRVSRGATSSSGRRDTRWRHPTRAASRVDPFADPVVPRDPDARLPDLDWTAEVPVTEGKFAGYTLLASAFTGEEVEAVADLLLGSGMAGFPLERRTLLVYLRGAVPAFPHGTYLVGRLRAPRAGTIEGRSLPDASLTLDDASLASPRSSWSEEKSSAHGPVVATVGVSFTEATRRKFSSLKPPSDAAYLSDLTVFEQERGNGLGIAMLAAAEAFAVDMKSPSMYLHVATKKPGVVKLYKSQGYAIRAVDPGIFGWRGRLLMRKPMA